MRGKKSDYKVNGQIYRKMGCQINCHKLLCLIILMSYGCHNRLAYLINRRWALKQYQWIFEHIVEFADQLNVKLALRIFCLSIMGWGIVDVLDVLKSVQSLHQLQEKRFLDRSKLLAEIIQWSQLNLSLGHGDSKDLEQIFKGYDDSLRDKLEKHYKLTYGLTLYAKEATKEIKLTRFGRKDLGVNDVSMLERLSPSEEYKFGADSTGDIYLIRPCFESLPGYVLCLKISAKSIAKLFDLGEPEGIQVRELDESSAKPEPEIWQQGKDKLFRLPISKNFNVLYSEPEILFLDEMKNNLQTNGLWLILYVIFSSLGSVVLYGLISMKIAKGFREKLIKQEDKIVHLDQELAKFKVELQISTEIINSDKIQDKAESGLLTELKQHFQRPIQSNLVASGDKHYRSNGLNSIHSNLNGEEIMEVQGEILTKRVHLDMMDVLQEILNCFEVTRRNKNVTIVNLTECENPIIILASQRAFKVILYNVIKRVFSRLNRNGQLFIEILESPDLITLYLIDDGYDLEEDHCSYFAGTSGLLRVMMQGHELMAQAKRENISLSTERIPTDQTRVTLKMQRDPQPDMQPEGRTNVVQFNPKN